MSKLKHLKVAIAGCGKIADGHVEEIQKLPETTVVAVCDLEPLMAEQLATRYEIERFYGDFAQLLDREKPDVVHITTPPQSHLPLARAAMEAGCHVYVEKPLAMNSTQANEIVRVAQETKRKLTIGYWYNFEPHMLALRTMVDEGVLGEPVHVESFYGYNLTGAYGAAFLSDPKHWLHRLPGQLFHNILDHILNKVTLFLPDEAPGISAAGFKRREEIRGDASDAVLDELRVLMVGRKVSGYATLSSHAKPVGHFMRLYGTAQTAHVDFNTRTVVLDRAPTLPSAIGRLLPPFAQSKVYWGEGMRNARRFMRSEFAFFAGMNELIRRFYTSIREDSEPPICYREMLRISVMMDQIFAQVYKGREVS